MTTRDFDYTADRFDPEAPRQMATLRWSTLENGTYHNHSLRMPHDGFAAAKDKALELMRADYPNAKLSIRSRYRNGNFYCEFLVDATETTDNK